MTIKNIQNILRKYDVKRYTIIEGLNCTIIHISKNYNHIRKILIEYELDQNKPVGVLITINRTIPWYMNRFKRKRIITVSEVLSIMNGI